jgi:hypothetical protein
MELNTVDSSHTLLNLTYQNQTLYSLHQRNLAFSHFEKSIYPSTFGRLNA